MAYTPAENVRAFLDVWKTGQLDWDNILSFSDIDLTVSDLEALLSINADMFNALTDLSEYFDQRSDISEHTTDAGQPLPNEEMQIAARLYELLKKIEETL